MGKECLLLVDDEQNILNALKRELREWARERDLEIVTATSARLGLEFLAERGDDTVIIMSDLKMPEMKGTDFLMQALNDYPDTVAILLTGLTDEAVTAKAVGSGLFSCILKPWDSAQLLEELQRAYDRNRSRKPSSQSAG
jgi:DNA-binding NtrC family response regulator